jgi:hypothetical protein
MDDKTLAAEFEKARKADERFADLVVKAILAVGRNTLTAMMERDMNRLRAVRAAEADLVAEVVTRGGIVPNNHWHDRHRLEQRLRTEQALLNAIEAQP